MKKALLSAILSITLCVSLIVGSTFALFVTESKVNVAVTSANVDVTATVREGSMKTYSYDKNGKTVVEQAPRRSFAMGGSAVAEKNEVKLADVTPGDKVTFTVDVVNNSTVTVMYRTRVVFIDDTGLAEALDVFAGGEQISLEGNYSKWQTLDIKDSQVKGNVAVVEMVIDFPYEEGDQTLYMGKSCTVVYTVEAVQGNAKVEQADVWDGTADTSWYNDTDTEFTLSTAEQFAGFAELVSEDADNFAGKTIKLGTDIDLGLEDENGNPISFAPIGTTGERDGQNRLVTEPFKGTFDGNGHTIASLYQSGWDFGYEWGQYGSIGLFSELEGATVKNVVLEGFDCQVEGGDISFIAGSATGNCTFENIEIKSGSIGTYNNGIGGIIGWSGAGTYNFKNITLGEDVVIGGLWGSFDSSAGGIVGQAEPGATYNFDNVNVACRLDVYNDCTASYDYYNYRMSGMLIGRLEETTTIDGTNYPDTSKYNITCTNVTVTYGDWANYHYCDPTPGYNNGRGMRVEPGYAYGGLPADYDHSQCTTHHMELIPFDQLFGGDQLGVKGLKTYDGVTVNYNNK